MAISAVAPLGPVDPDLSDYGVAGAIMVVTQYLKPMFSDWATRFVPIIPLVVALGWCWAEERSKGPVVNWGLVGARSFKLFFMSVGYYAAGKQAFKKE